MHILDIDTIKVGSITESEYRTQNGELLIPEGVLITEKHLDYMRRRNIFQVYVKKSAEDESHEILSKEYSLEDLNFDGEIAKQEAEPKHAPRVLDLPEFQKIKSGREGLEQLSKSKKASTLDDDIAHGFTPDRPRGPALKQRLADLSVADRTPKYKQDMLLLYQKTLREIRYLMKTLADGNSIDGRHIRVIVERFVRIFVADKNILLNLACTKADPEDFLFQHTLNVCLLAISIAASADFSEEQVVEIGMGALLHDAGMLLVPDGIVKKKGKLTEDEWFEIQKHAILGLHLLESVMRLPITVPYVAYQCHERENGKGYPKQRNARLIHTFAKIVQIADVFEAMSSPRCYREAYIPYKAMESAIKMTRQGLLAGDFLRSFLLYLSLFPIGSIVELSNGCIGKVIKANGTSFAKPVISVLFDSQGKILPTQLIYQEDLRNNSDLQITKAHGPEFLKGVAIMDGF